MAQTTSQQERKTRWFGVLVGTGLTVLLGWLLLLPLGDGLTRLSYDLPLLMQKGTPDELVMVYLDSTVKKNLGQPEDQPLDRHFYTQLLERLTADGAKLVLFDIIFDTPHPDPAVDEQFAQAMRRHGRVVLVAEYIKELQGNVMMDSPMPPITQLADAARWGLGKVSPDPDFAIRQIDGGVADYPSLSWVAATLLEAPVTKNPDQRLAPRWLNYYGPPGWFRSVNLDQALETNGLPAGFFRDKIVMVGARPGLGLAGAAREEFFNPYSRVGERAASGPAVQALSLLNLLRGDWLTRMSHSRELALVLIWGVLITLLLLKFRPWIALLVGVFCAALFAVFATWLQLQLHVWFAWVIPAVVQTSFALLWSGGYQYLVEARRRKQLRRAFGSYLSPYMADRIANSEFDLKLGGKEVVATVMFTDLEGFTKMSETLPPAEVSKILTTYFNQTTRDILKQDGTIIKYIGDAVMAVWGAPMEDPRHAERAVLAAWGMSEACKQEVEGRRLRTRIGVNTGIVLAGNLGSDFRFDYTLIGDTTNFASRLEGLNKYLGTDVLISESTRAQAGEGIKLRFIGNFLVVGKKTPVGIYEVLGLAASFSQDPAWLTAFNQAMGHFVKRELDLAEKLMRETMAARGGKDGPAEFYLEEITKARKLDANLPWDGTVRFGSK